MQKLFNVFDRLTIKINSYHHRAHVYYHNKLYYLVAKHILNIYHVLSRTQVCTHISFLASRVTK